jgi:hypothetical protein
MKTIALLVLLGQAAAPISDNVWMNPKTHVLRPMYVYPNDDLIAKIRDKRATLAEVQEMFAMSKPEAYRDAFLQSPEATVIATGPTQGRVYAFDQLVMSKKDGVTHYWFVADTRFDARCLCCNPL